MQVEGRITAGKKAILQHQLNKWAHRITSLLDDGKQKNPIAVLDGVRAIACILILVFHFHVIARDNKIWNTIPDFGSVGGAIAFAGENGVQLFFVLSGFLLFLPFAKVLLFGGPWPSFKNYYLRRIFRIVPAYYVALFLMILIWEPKYLQPSYWDKLWLFLTFRMDFAQTFQQINGPFWTLAVEFQFYIILPLIAWAINLLVRNGTLHQRLLKVTFCLLVLVAWGVFSLYWGQEKIPFLVPLKNAPFIKEIMPYIYSGKGKFLEVFAIGMLCSTLYVYYKSLGEQHSWSMYTHRFSPLLFAAGFLILAFMAIWHFYMWYFNYAFHFLDPYHKFLVSNWSYWHSLCYAIGFGLCIFALLHGPQSLKRCFEWTPLRWIGLISFSLYMWHVPLMNVFAIRINPILRNLGLRRIEQYTLFALWAIVVIFLVAAVSFILIEKPGIRLGKYLESLQKNQAVDKNKMTETLTLKTFSGKQK